MITSLKPITQLPSQLGETGYGIYFLTEYKDCVGPSHQQRLQVKLEDGTGALTGFVWPEHRAKIMWPQQPLAPVEVTAKVKQFDAQPQLNILHLAPVPIDQLNNASGLIPRRFCPQQAHAALDKLIQLERDLPEPLKGFVRRVLLDSELGMPFLNTRASVGHHHAYAGGLLVHSTEMLDIARQLTIRMLPNDRQAVFLAQVAYLFHDLGKIESVGKTHRAKYGLVIRHEFRTLELLAPHLKWLEQRHKEWTVALRYIFTYLATPFRSRPFPTYAVAEIVEKLDQWSAGAFNQLDTQSLLCKSYHRYKPTSRPQLPHSNQFSATHRFDR